MANSNRYNWLSLWFQRYSSFLMLMQDVGGCQYKFFLKIDFSFNQIWRYVVHFCYPLQSSHMTSHFNISTFSHTFLLILLRAWIISFLYSHSGSHINSELLFWLLFHFCAFERLLINPSSLYLHLFFSWPRHFKIASVISY